VLSAGLGIGTRAAAQPSSDAEAQFRAGRQASVRGDHEAACARFRESYRLERAAGTLLNIAVCEEALGELASALQHYREVMAELPASDKRIAFLRARVEALAPRLPLLTVRLAKTTPQDALVEIDALALSAASFDVPMPWNPGDHELRVTAEGHVPSSHRFTLSEGQVLTLEAQAGPLLEPVVLAAPQAQDEPLRPSFAELAPRTARGPRHESTRSSTRRAVGYTGLVLSGGGLLVSAVTFALALDRKAVVDEHCPARMCDDTGASAVHAGRSFVTASWLGLAAGLVAGAAGVYGLWPAEVETSP